MKRSLNWIDSEGASGNIEAFLALALNRSRVCVTMQRQDGSYLFIANLPDCWRISGNDKPDASRIFGSELGRQMNEAAHQARQGGKSASFITTAGEERFFEVSLEAIDIDGAGAMMTVIMEITEEQRREQVLRALLREVSHRSKNLLAIILSIASQTARATPDLPTFLQKFRGRVYGLSQSQDLITESSWRGARLRDLVQAQAAKYVQDTGAFLSFAGDDVLLSPNEALHVGMALHELVVNAVHGSGSDGVLPHVRISSGFDTAPSGEKRRLIEWRQPIPASGSMGEEDFASTVLERVTPSAVDGEACYGVEGAELVYRLVFRETASE